MSTSNKLAGKVALVTGASKGIGAAIAKQFAREGASVVVNYASSKSAAARVVDEIAKTGGTAIAIQADVSKPADITRLVAETKKAFGPLDILVNNAGVYEFLPIEKITPTHFHKQFDLNVLGLLLTIQEALNHFSPNGGSIINISSVVSTLALPQSSVYSASKAAVDIASKALSKELGARKIRVNTINPGMIETEGLHASGFAEGDFRKQIESQTPLGRIGQPEDIAKTALFLASDESSWITGEKFVVSGGNN